MIKASFMINVSEEAQNTIVRCSLVVLQIALNFRMLYSRNAHVKAAMPRRCVNGQFCFCGEECFSVMEPEESDFFKSKLPCKFDDECGWRWSNYADSFALSIKVLMIFLALELLVYMIRRWLGRNHLLWTLMAMLCNIAGCF